tara:strand:+ start:581 stop:808 length:228 start_codon:yes stop_codon:yes gene_type:complete
MEDKPRVGELFTRIQTAKKQANKMLSNHVRRVAVHINKMTGIKRGANVARFNELVESIAETRFVVEAIEVNDSWR